MYPDFILTLEFQIWMGHFLPTFFHSIFRAVLLYSQQPQRFPQRTTLSFVKRFLKVFLIVGQVSPLILPTLSLSYPLQTTHPTPYAGTLQRISLPPAHYPHSTLHAYDPLQPVLKSFLFTYRPPGDSIFLRVPPALIKFPPSSLPFPAGFVEVTRDFL